MEKLVDIIEDLVINSGWEISEIVELTPEDIFDNFEITVTEQELDKIINTAINKYCR
jgi:hypothetical protein|nr:MAG TPA: hypothetical protein [Caudoviricetes sp.]